MKKQNIWLWALTAAVVLLAAALAETQGQLGELQTAYSALQQEVGELRLDLKSTQNRLQEQEEALERAAAQTAPQPEESLLERYELTPLRLDAAAHQVELGVSLTLTTPDQSAEATLNVYQGGAERKRLAQVELTRSGDGIFSGQAAVPADSTSLQILVTVRTGGDTATERLYEGRATGLLPMALSSRSLRADIPPVPERSVGGDHPGRLRPGIRHLGGHRDGILRRRGPAGGAVLLRGRPGPGI